MRRIQTLGNYNHEHESAEGLDVSLRLRQRDGGIGRRSTEVGGSDRIRSWGGMRHRSLNNMDIAIGIETEIGGSIIAWMQRLLFS